MPNLTANYNLKKPLGSEKMDINVLNENFDNIDEEIFKINNSKNQPNGIARLDENKELLIENIPCKIKTIYEHSSGTSLELTNVPFHENIKTEIQISAVSATYDPCILKINGIEIFNKFENGQNRPLFARVLIDRVGTIVGGIVYNDGSLTDTADIGTVISLVCLDNISKKIQITSNNTIELTGCYSKPTFKVIGYGR